MSGRFRLSWVTALTVASLLLGAGTLNVLADNHGKGHGGGSGKVEQSASHGGNHGPAANDRRGRDHDDDKDDDDLVTPPARVTDEVRPGKGCGDDNHEHLRHDECKGKFLDHDDDDEEMELDDD